MFIIISRLFNIKKMFNYLINYIIRILSFHFYLIILIIFLYYNSKHKYQKDNKEIMIQNKLVKVLFYKIK